MEQIDIGRMPPDTFQEYPDYGNISHNKMYHAGNSKCDKAGIKGIIILRYTVRNTKQHQAIQNLNNSSQTIPPQFGEPAFICKCSPQYHRREQVKKVKFIREHKTREQAGKHLFSKAT